MSLTSSLRKIVTSTADTGANVIEEGGGFVVGVLGTGKDFAEQTREVAPHMWGDYLKQARKSQQQVHAATARIDGIRQEAEMIAAAAELQEEIVRLGKGSTAAQRLNKRLQALLDDEEVAA